MAFSDPGTEFSGLLGTSLLSYLAHHPFQALLFGPLLLDDVLYSIAPTLTPLSSLVVDHDFTDGVT